MANKAKSEGKDGIDRWTSNGYGITVGKPDKEEKEKANKEFRKVLKGEGK